MLLKYKDGVVASLKMIGKKPVGYKEIYRKDLLPIGSSDFSSSAKEAVFFKEWLKSRSVPNLRQNLDAITSKMGTSVDDGWLASLGVSLSDTYWFCEENSPFTWRDVNFYDNGFECTFALIAAEKKPSTFRSPDFTTDGVMEKFWYTSGGQAFLAKIDEDNVRTANEVVAYEIANLAGIQTTPYFYGEFEEHKICSCPNYGTPDADYVSALQIKHANLNTTTGTGLARYFDYQLGLKKELDGIRFLDALLHQEDRHEKNVGIFIKNHDLSTATLVPAFDNGSCLGFGRAPSTSSSKDDLKFFKKSRTEVMNDIENLPNISQKDALDILRQTYKDFGVSNEQLLIAEEELLEGFQLYQNALKSKECSIGFEEEHDL